MSSSRLSNSNISDVDTNTTTYVHSSFSRYWDCGVADHRCQHCQAVLWYEEGSIKWYNPHNPKFVVCCGDGKVKLDHMRKPPALRTALCNYNGGQRSKFFRKHIKLINSMFVFTSTGGRINRDINDGHRLYTFCLNSQNHHRIETLLPTHVDGRPRFAQLYIYDTANETENPKAFRMAKERFSDSSQQPVSIRLLGSRRRDQRPNQSTICSELYNGLHDQITNGETNMEHIGRRVVLPSTFTGGPRYMIQQYHDAMIARHVEDHIPEQHVNDRSAIITKMFKIKLDELIKDIMKKHFFGRVKACALMRSS
ncbi:putative DNA helicase [Tanacetum coccineum]